MPLKHHTETALIAVLGAITVLTGIVVSSLPILPVGLVPWGIVFLSTLLYPFAVYPLLKRHRADYEFRALHFAPAGIALLWFLLQAAALKAPLFLRAHRWFTWGLSFFPVTLTLVLLALFCLHVIRRRLPRLITLAGLFVPLLILAAVTESGIGRVDGALASVLWNTGSSSSAAVVAVATSSDSSAPLPTGSGKNLSPSHDAEEEAWRARLRAMASRSSAALAAGTGSISASSRANSSASIIAAKPNRLPGSGFGAEVVMPMFIAGYFGVVHARAKRRK